MEKKGMSLVELQQILGERIRIATDPEMDEEQRKRETEISQTVACIAKQMINNADVVLRANKLAAEGKLKSGDAAILKMVEG